MYGLVRPAFDALILSLLMEGCRLAGGYNGEEAMVDSTATSADQFLPFSNNGLDLVSDKAVIRAGAGTLASALGQPRRLKAATGAGGSSEEPTSNEPSTTDGDDAVHEGPGEAFGKATLIISMTIFFTLIISLTILDKVLARRRSSEGEEDG
mmetsp:Transcript_34907/g.87955  ORF Transcript_34907/g.87955 Transcript_34907/m.87955 type:complete len:152 (+) Transcript_34907:72-527(+)